MQETHGEERWEADSGPPQVMCMPLSRELVLEEDLGLNQPAEQDLHSGATNPASGMGFSWTSDSLCAVLSSKEWAQNGEKIRHMSHVTHVMAEVAVSAGITHMWQA